MRADINQTDIASKDTAAADCSGRPRRREREIRFCAAVRRCNIVEGDSDAHACI